MKKIYFVLDFFL